MILRMDEERVRLPCTRKKNKNMVLRGGGGFFACLDSKYGLKMPKNGHFELKF